jgi:atypical dual specificity phosphatase
MPAPGMTAELEYDLELIRGAGVTCLVTLTMTPLPAGVLRQHGLQSVFFPIEDMGTPTLEAAAKLCDQLAEMLSRGQVVGFHCKAGYGRTGTMLASQLIWEGADAKAALAQVRAVDPNWVQSDSQERFLSSLAEWRQANRTTRHPATSRMDDRAEPSADRRDARTSSNPKRGVT